MPIPQAEVLSRTFIRDEVYQYLLGWIVNGTLAPEEKLKDKDLAARLGVSRTPVREALRKLEDEGLVETAANRWTRVAPVTLKDAEHIYAIIQALETLALELAFPRLSISSIKQMQLANRQLKAALGSDTPQTAVQADATFHQILIDAADSAELQNILKHLKTKYQRIELAYFSNADLLLASFEEHQQLLTALENNNLDLARQALVDNWQASIDRLRASAEHNG